MQRVSLGVSLVAVLLMAGGFLDFAVTPDHPLRLPGDSAVPLARLVHPTFSTLGIDLMSGGILVLATLPAVRVLLALVLYARQHAWQNVAAALGVLLILVLSTLVK